MRRALLAAAIAAAAPAAAHDTAVHGAAVHGPADGWAFPVPEPGSYALPPVGPAADGTALDETGAAVSLAALWPGRLTVLAFMYARCGDLCPLASARLADLQALAAAEPALVRRLRLVSLSFDPAHDTPAVMADYAEAFSDPAGPEWLFLTAPDAATLAPTLAAYGQTVLPRRDAGAGPFAHVLRVFLIDGAGVIRNVYDADFLDPRLLVADMLTLEAGGW